MKKRDILICGTSRFVDCAKKGPAGAAYNMQLTKCKRCKHHIGLEAEEDKYGLVVSGQVLCKYGEK